MDDLRSKLKSLGFNPKSTDSIVPKRPKKNIVDVVDGQWTRVNHSELFTIVDILPYPINFGRHTVNGLPDFSFFSEILDDCNYDLHSRRFIFLDTETSSLGVGAATFIFLIGLCWFDEDGLHVTQFFLDDLSKETDFLLHIDGFLNQFMVLVTYNGKSFDIPLLQSRYTINGIPNNLMTKKHADLLHVSRRLYKNNLESRRLSDLETHVLAFQRSEEDVSGWLIPQIFFDYLESGESEPLLGIFYHNEMDVISLSILADLYGKFFKAPHSLPSSFNQLIGMAELLRSKKKLLLSKKFYAMSFENLEISTDKKNEYLNYAQVLKSTGDWQEAMSIWETCAAHGDVSSCVELAKYYEHRENRYSSAQKWAEKAIANAHQMSMSPIVYNQLEHRLDRIKIKRVKYG